MSLRGPIFILHCTAWCSLRVPWRRGLGGSANIACFCTPLTCELPTGSCLEMPEGKHGAGGSVPGGKGSCSHRGVSRSVHSYYLSLKCFCPEISGQRYHLVVLGRSWFWKGRYLARADEEDVWNYSFGIAFLPVAFFQSRSVPLSLHCILVQTRCLLSWLAKGTQADTITCTEAAGNHLSSSASRSHKSVSLPIAFHH